MRNLFVLLIRFFSSTICSELRVIKMQSADPGGPGAPGGVTTTSITSAAAATATTNIPEPAKNESTWSKSKSWMIRWRGSRQLVLVIVAIALLLDNMLLTVVGK